MIATSVQQEKLRRLRAEQWRATKAKTAAMTRRARTVMSRLLGQIDAAMKAAAGEGNDVLYRFLQVFVGVFAGGIVIGGIVCAWYWLRVWAWVI